MRKALLDKMCCPFDKQDLQVTIISEIDEEIHEGIMLCPDCKRYFPIIYGIPIMTPDEYRQKGLEAPVMEKWGLSVDPQNSERFVIENTQKVIEE